MQTYFGICLQKLAREGLILIHSYMSLLHVLMNLIDLAVPTLRIFLVPGRDGSTSYFFHKSFKTCSTGQYRKVHDDDSRVVCWQKNGETKPLIFDGIHQGYKTIMTLHTSMKGTENPNWIMHQYHLGMAKDEEEEFVVSKIFTQRIWQIDGNADNAQEANEPIPRGAESAIFSKSVVPKTHHVEHHLDLITSREASQDILIDDQDTNDSQPLKDLITDSEVEDCIAKTGGGGKNGGACSEDDVLDNVLLHERFCMLLPSTNPNNITSRCYSDVSNHSLNCSSENSLHAGDNGFATQINSMSNIETSCGKDIFELVQDISSGPLVNSITESDPSQVKSEILEHDLRDSHLPESVTPNTVSNVMAEPSRSIASSCYTINRCPPNVLCCQNNVLLRTGFPEENHDNNCLSSYQTSAHEVISAELVNSDCRPPLSLSNRLTEVKDEPMEADSNEITEKDGEPKLASMDKFVSCSSCGATPSLSEPRICPKCNLMRNSKPLGDQMISNCLREPLPPGRILVDQNDANKVPDDAVKIEPMEEICANNGLGTTGENCINTSLKTSGKLASSSVSYYSAGTNKYTQFSQRNNHHQDKPSSISCDVQRNISSISLCLGPSSLHINSTSSKTLSSVSEQYSNNKSHISRAKVKEETNDYLSKSMQSKLVSLEPDSNSSLKNSEQFLPQNQNCEPVKSVDSQGSHSSLRRKRKKTATDSVEQALEEDAPGLLQVLLDKGITPDEIKLYGTMEEDEALDIPSEDDNFNELEAVVNKIFSARASLFKFSVARHMKGSKAVYCLACLISLIEQTRYLQFRDSPVEWGWCRDLQSFIFIFHRHNRIVLERPEYGYATYFFGLVDSLPIDWQIKRLVTAMKLTSCSRSTLMENKPLVVGEDLTEGEARVLEEYGWSPNCGLGTMLNYCDRVVHDKKNERYSDEWRAKIGKLLMVGHDAGRTVIVNMPKRLMKYATNDSLQIKMEN
ncbi:hypothetical protein Cni_G11307 [Canna indica]|uniref:NAC domain-containing protein n=1 Tax=Canna indica TaxID=4628 RepID=A0AAQ3K8G6_9LILI|nr:hypothetical protein Cni_G11307 [Canna indica]